MGSLKARSFRAAVAWLLLAAATVGAPRKAGASAPSAYGEADHQFALRVYPLLESKCFGCHGGDNDDTRGGFSLASREGILAGGESGEAAVVPGDPEASPLYQSVRWDGLEMPPKENDRLTPDEVEAIRAWIEDGARWLDAPGRLAIVQAERAAESNADGRLVATSGGSSDAWTYRRYRPEDLWAFEKVPPKRTDLLPAGVDLSRAIDVLVDKRLREAGLTPAAEAPPRTLVRRATLGLTGLPPTPEEADAFDQAWARDPDTAWVGLIDRLLASPRYGEHWGRHWLDVTRYADTGGMSNDYERSNLWRYRDYVIRSFNADKPYDCFVVEQLAGDELADRSVRRRGRDAHGAQLLGDYTKQEAEWIVATGFLRIGPWDNAMVKPPEARQMYLDDLVNITGQTFLAQTLRCCKCHDHKFDPIPTRDYYRLYSAFATTHPAERAVPFTDQENLSGFEEGDAHVQRMLAFAIAEKQQLVDKREAAAREWFESRGLPYQDHARRKSLPDEEKPPRHVGLDHVEQGQLKVREQDEWIWRRRRERYRPMAQSVFNAAAVGKGAQAARRLRIDRRPAIVSAPGNHILLGGALTALGDAVRPGVLSALALPASPEVDDPYLVTTAAEGRRLALANWVANPGNGLTTRAIVNRIWQGHFGVGLAPNANNFGAKGGRPSHPDLLDYLAADFVEHGWRLKRLHRAIMLSEAYRRSSTPADGERVARADPGNRLLSHFPRRRLSAEELRDGVLAITGELNLTAGGAPVMPEINLEVALQPRMIQFSLAPAYQPSPTPGQRNRRTVYAYHVRGQADPFTEVFNQPNPNESCELRGTAAVTPQAFTLLNSRTMTQRSIAFAQRLRRERATPAGRIDRAFRLALGRPASPGESGRLVGYLREMEAYHRQTPAEPTTYPTRITRSLVEEFSGKPFEYVEILPVFEDYQADAQPPDVSPATRALADVCLLLLNTNEFMYVD